MWESPLCKRCESPIVGQNARKRVIKVGKRRGKTVVECKMCFEDDRDRQRLRRGAWYREQLKEQRGKCALCSKRKASSVDHCHTSGKVREILCNQCNLALGLFNDSPELLRAAADYIDHWRVHHEAGARAAVALARAEWQKRTLTRQYSES